MIKKFISFFIIISSFPFLLYSMDQQDNSIKRIIDMQDVQSIAFIANEEFLFNQFEHSRGIVSIDSGKTRSFRANNIHYTMVIDKSKRRILLARQTYGWWDLVVYDPKLQSLRFESNVPYLNDDKRTWQISFDERKPTSVLIPKDNYIISYDYLTHVEEPCDDYLSKVFQNRNLGDFKCAFNNKLGIYVIGQSNQGFVVFFKSPDSISCENILYKFPATDNMGHHYLCSSDMSFIVCYGFNKENGFCSIVNKKNNDNVILLGSEDHKVYPYGMEIHPNDKVLVTISVDGGVIQYWQAATGTLLSEQKMLNSKEGDIDEEKRKIPVCYRNFSKYLAISANGKLLAAVYRDQVVIYHIPLEALCGMTRKSLIGILWCLKNMPLPKDVGGLIFEALQA